MYQLSFASQSAELYYSFKNRIKMFKQGFAHLLYIHVCICACMPHQCISLECAVAWVMRYLSLHVWINIPVIISVSSWIYQRLNKHLLSVSDMHLHQAVGSQPFNLQERFVRSIGNVMYSNFVSFAVLTGAEGTWQVRKGKKALNAILYLIYRVPQSQPNTTALLKHCNHWGWGVGGWQVTTHRHTRHMRP